MRPTERKQTWIMATRALLVNVMFFLCIASSVHAQVEIVHDFLGTGFNPRGSLIQAMDGFLYGTTLTGGIYNQGTVFRVNGAGQVTTVHSFQCSVVTNGCNPRGR